MKDDEEGRTGEGADARPTPTLEEVLAHDDLDAAWRFFAAAKNEPLAAAGATTLDFSRFRARRIRLRLLSLLDELVVAIERRDLQAVWDVLDEADARRCFPPTVREEALVIARLPPTAVRPPVRLYRYHHVLSQLGDEPVEEVPPDQLPPTASGDEDGGGRARGIVFPGRPPRGGGPRSGPDRRRSGSR
jgi:hypothetical protein